MRRQTNEEQEFNEESEISAAGVSEDPHAKRKAVIPGEIIVSGEDFLPGEGARREGNDIVSARFGLAEQAGRIVKVLAVTGAFIPRRNNVVIGRVTNITFRGWVVDIDSAADGFLPIEESPRFVNKNAMDQYLAIGDVIAAKIWSVGGKGIDLSLRGKGFGKLEGGFIFRVIPNRVPRIIGREGSMISLIKDKTGCGITVGQNGWIWINGPTIEAQVRARKAIEFVADKVFVEGLTEKVEEWFEKN
ncbi:MAG: KH domain-containing protein [archaeon]|jgi:exosome complex component RRP4|nr:KH domain-containing protein [archaeon]